jgi:hypothetical protein
MNAGERATKSATTFRMECAIRTSIQASPEKIWALP